MGSQIPSLEERERSQAIQLSLDTALEDEIRREARLLARWELDTHLAIEASREDEFGQSLGVDLESWIDQIWLSRKLLWLQRPAALKVLLHPVTRPMWLRAWRL